MFRLLSGCFCVLQCGSRAIEKPCGIGRKRRPAESERLFGELGRPVLFDRKRIVRADHDAIRANGVGKESQGRAVIQDRVIVECLRHFAGVARKQILQRRSRRTRVPQARKKAASLKVPILDEAGFDVLLERGPDAAREVAQIGDPAAE